MTSIVVIVATTIAEELWPLEDVGANCLCVSFLHTQFPHLFVSSLRNWRDSWASEFWWRSRHFRIFATRVHGFTADSKALARAIPPATQATFSRAHAISNKMSNNSASGHCYDIVWIYQSCTFSDPYFSFDRSLFSTIFHVLRKKKWKKICIVQVWSFCSTHSEFCSVLRSSFSCTTAANASLRVNLYAGMKRMETFEIINATDPFYEIWKVASVDPSSKFFS